MRHLINASLTVLIACCSASAQIRDEESSAIREALGLPASTAVAAGKSDVVPEAVPLKVYAAGAVNDAFRSSLSVWVAEWNKKDGRKYGTLEVIGDRAEADLLLVRVNQSWPLTERDKQMLVGFVAGANFLGVKGDGSSLTLGYSYLIVPKPAALEIIWRQPGPARAGQPTEYAGGFSEELKKRLKARAKAAKRRGSPGGN